MTRQPTDDGLYPFSHHLLVCIGPRCTDRKLGQENGERIREMLKEHNRQLGRKPVVRVCGVSCLDLCDFAPNMVEWPSGRVWTGLDAASALRAYHSATADLDDDGP